MFLKVQKSVRERTLTLQSEFPCWELESRWTPESLEGDSKGQSQWIEEFFISLESYWNLDD